MFMLLTFVEPSTILGWAKVIGALIAFLATVACWTAMIFHKHTYYLNAGLFYFFGGVYCCAVTAVLLLLAFG